MGCHDLAHLLLLCVRQIESREPRPYVLTSMAIASVRLGLRSVRLGLSSLLGRENRT